MSLPSLYAKYVIRQHIYILYFKTFLANIYYTLYVFQVTTGVCFASNSCLTNLESTTSPALNAKGIKIIYNLIQPGYRIMIFTSYFKFYIRFSLTILIYSISNFFVSFYK